jgi:2-oxoglutarate dehydrogenase E2 component (dihydrolipoamide succinyltransferase)
MSALFEMRDKYKDAFEKVHGVKLGFMSPFIKVRCRSS